MHTRVVVRRRRGTSLAPPAGASEHEGGVWASLFALVLVSIAFGALSPLSRCTA